ncbi:LytR C-terminal domain-containing protein [Saccharothrix hoggarensis]|uniref:LytR C-terminal domain-containing protein n=1 Tax=Saccharothrix hoggarensis TaxID=913853 RepID=A0ABW3QVT0_9PSEU
MTNPEQPTGPAQPARAAGYALLGVAVIALVIGLVSLFTGGPDDDPPGAQPTDQSTTQPGTSDTAGQPTGDPTSPSPSPAPSESPTSGATTPPATTGNPGTPGATDTPPPPVTTAPKPPVRVYNNSTTQGLAAEATEDVEKAGWQVAEKGNYSQGLIPTTTVYFRPGTDEEASARELAQIIGARVEPRFDGIQNAQPGIIVIVTNDYKGTPAKVS